MRRKYIISDDHLRPPQPKHRPGATPEDRDAATKSKPWNKNQPMTLHLCQSIRDFLARTKPKS